mgnify:CR=1 FL=1
MSQNFLERCNEKMQSIYDYCGTKAKQLYAELLAAVQSLYNHCEVKARKFYAMLLEKVQLLYNDCLEKNSCDCCTGEGSNSCCRSCCKNSTGYVRTSCTSAGYELCKQGAG